jgi:hypothetical protein
MDNIKIDVEKEECGGLDWMELAEGRHRWRAFANAGTFCFHKMRGIS